MQADSKNRWSAENKEGKKSGTYTEQNEWHGLVVNIRGETNTAAFQDSGLILKADVFLK